MVEESNIFIVFSFLPSNNKFLFTNIGLYYLVIENMSCQGHTVGGKFNELAGIIERVKDKLRIGICLDTCHMFAAGM